jgi:hypothetical protein
MVEGRGSRALAGPGLTAVNGRRLGERYGQLQKTKPWTALDSPQQSAIISREALLQPAAALSRDDCQEQPPHRFKPLQAVLNDLLTEDWQRGLIPLNAFTD